MDMLAHFGFRKTPFTLEISPEEHLDLPHFDSALARVMRVVDKRLCATITSVPGAGKTSLIRLLEDRLPDARYRVFYVKVTNLSKRDFCREIAAVCGIAPVGSYPSLVRKLQEHWETANAVDGLRTILILDEAHDIRPEVLAILRILTNFEKDSRLVISIVLAGQSSLKAMLSRDELEDVAKRIATYVDLRLLSRDETQLYIEHRCAIAGAATTPLDNPAGEAIYEMSRGNMRAIDRLALEALELAAEAKADVVSSGHVVAAKRNLWP